MGSVHNAMLTKSIPQPAPTRRWHLRFLRGCLTGTLIAVASITLLLFVGEGLLRLSGYLPPELIENSVRGTYRSTPGASFTYLGFRPGSPVEFRIPIVLNQLGFHDRDYAPTRPTPRTYRVMVLGDSYVSAMEVEVRQTFHKLLEERLNAEDPLGRGSYEVIGFGRGNSAQQAELDWLRTYGPRYRPDMVLLVFFCGNDVMENSSVTYNEAQRYAIFYMRLIAERKIALYNRLFVVRHSRLNGFLAERAAIFYTLHMNLFHPEMSREQLAGPDVEVYRSPPAPEWLEAWRQTAGLLDEVRRETARQGAEYAMAVIAGPQAIAEDEQEQLRGEGKNGFDVRQPERWVSGWCVGESVPCLSLAKSLRAADAARVFWTHDSHLTPFGHRVAADALYPFLVDLMRQGERKDGAPGATLSQTSMK